MNIKKYIKECYEVAREKGFYPDDSKIEDHLMGIVSELGEAYEAHRNNKFSTNQMYTLEDYLIEDEHKDFRMAYFKNVISGTFEDEIADVFIRLFNLCGFMDIEPEKLPPCRNHVVYESASYVLLFLSSIVSEMREDTFDRSDSIPRTLGRIFAILDIYVNQENIPIEKHIQAKHEYNKTREHLHGKKY